MPRHRSIHPGALVVLALVLAALSPLAMRAAARTDVPELLGQREIQLPDSRILSLSPDGSTLVASDMGRTKLCVYETATLAERSCADLTPLEARLRLEDVTWSPDGRYLALAEDSFRLFRDGDLWLMDAQSGALTNLTDDGYSGKIPLSSDAAAGETIYFDICPAFSPDGRTIAFSRSTIENGERRGNVIATVPVTGGPATTLAEVSPDIPGVVYFGMQWTADGSTLYYNDASPDQDDPNNGLWRVNADGSDARLVLPADKQTGPPVVNRISPDGRTLLLSYPLVISQVMDPKRPYYALLDADTGEVTPIGPAADAPVGTEWILPVALSPDGTLLLTVNRFGNPANQVFVGPIGGEATALVPDGLPYALPANQYGTISWATDGTVMINTGVDAAVLLSIRGGTDVTVPGATPVPVVGTPASVEATPASGFAPGATVTTNDNDVPLRATPGRDGQTVATLPAGTALTTVGEPVEVDGQTWVPVRDPATNTLGWVRAEFLDVGPAG